MTYLRSLDIGSSAVLSIPLRGKPSPTAEDVYVVPHAKYSNVESIKYMQHYINKLREKMVHDFPGQYLSIRAYFDDVDQNRQNIFYGQSLCKQQARVWDAEGDVLLEGKNYMASELTLSREAYPIYVEENLKKTPFFSDILPVGQAYEFMIKNIPHELCEEILYYWNKCERIELSFNVGSAPNLVDNTHGIDSPMGTIQETEYTFEYESHRPICEN